VSGWQQVLDSLLRDRGAALVGYGYLLTGDLREAEDLLQDALVKVFARGRPAREVRSAEAYVRRTMLTTHIDGFRRRKHWESIRHLVVDDEPTTAGPDVSVPNRIVLADALQRLAPRERACIVLRYFDDLPVAEIGATLGISEGAVKRYLSDATHALEARLGPLSGSPAASETVPITHLPRRKR